MAQQQGATLTQAPQQIKVPCSFFTDLSAYLNSEVQVLGKGLRVYERVQYVSVSVHYLLGIVGVFLGLWLYIILMLLLFEVSR